jgi:hypothetical protein
VFQVRRNLTFCLRRKNTGGCGLLSVSLLKTIMKGTRFADVAAIQERVTAVLRSIPKEAVADSFQKLYERCQQCVVKDGTYFEGQ